MRPIRSPLVLLFALVFSSSAISQRCALLCAEEPPTPVTMTTQEDHRHMMQQLGITRLRPGPSGNPSAPNSANYDEALANPYPDLPDALTLKNGEKVTSADAWRRLRRPEIVEDFEREVFGRVPADVPAVTWEVIAARDSTVGELAVVEKELRGVVDNSRCPAIEVRIAMTLTIPKNVEQPVPVLMMFGGFGFGGGRPGTAPRPGAAPPRRFGPAGPSRTEQLLRAGWGYAMISPNSIQADNGQGLTRGIIGLTNRGQPRKPDDWGALRAWAWGASRGLDYLESEPAVDARRVGIEGVSRYGKAALVAMAFDQRFAMALVGSSGEGGAKLHRRNFGEAVENLTGPGEYHWMAGNFLKYGAAESSLGSLTAGDLPVDAHQLIALCAPRLTFISYGIPERGDANWLDQRGSFMAAVAAGPVFRLLGAKDLGTSDDYLNEKMPPVNAGLLDGALAWRQHDGGHTDGPNIEHFIRWADLHLTGKTSPPVEAAADSAAPAPQPPAPQEEARPRFQPPPPPVESPQVAEDRTATFRLRAASATAVSVESSDIPGLGFGRGAAMSKAEDGVWSVTLGPLPPGAYRYTFQVDGVTVADPVNPATSETNSGLNSLVLIPGSPTFDWKDIPHGAVAQATYFSKSLGRPRRLHVYTPPGYESGAEKHPVLYLLHGAFDCDATWTTVGRAGLILDNLIAAGKARPMIVVMPAGHTERFSFGAPDAINRQVDAFVEEFIADVRPFIEARYRVRGDRAGRAIAGLSMGGAQSLEIAVRALADYGYIGVFSSGVFSINPRGREPSGRSWAERHKAALADERLKDDLRLVWFATGKDDFLIETSRGTVSMLKEHGFNVEFQETEGGHTWLNWRNYLADFAPRLFQE